MRFFLLSLVFVLAGCASRGTRVVDVEVPTGPSEVPAQLPNNENVSATPLPETTVKKRVGLVLGGAGVASFATVGFLKRLGQENIAIDFIVSSGWPTLFALAYGYMNSIHDVEWFAMRLGEKDFFSAQIFGWNREYASQEKLSKLISGAFKQTDLKESRIPVLISTSNVEPGENQLIDSGDWKVPLLKTMSVPGIYEPYPQGKDNQWIASIQGLDVSGALPRKPDLIIAVDMYPDYFDELKKSKVDSADKLFRQLYLAQLRKSIQLESKQADLYARIKIGKSPKTLSAKRQAISAGYREASLLVKKIHEK